MNLREKQLELENSFEIATPKEFRFAENLSYLSRSTNECLLHVEDNSIYKLIQLKEITLLIEVSSNGIDKLNVRYPTTMLESDEYVRTAITDHVRDWFDLNTDLKPFYEVAHQDPLLKQVVNRFYGLRLMGIPNFFEAVCWGIIGQQINLPFAYTLKRRFVETYGTSVKWQRQTLWSFPTPEKIAELTVAELSELKMTVKKSEYIIGVAQLITEGRLTKELLLEKGDLTTAEKQLVAIRGIGPWTANYVLMRCLRFPAAFPIADVGLHNAIKHLTGANIKPTLTEIREHALAWTNWEAYATFYLWRLLY